MGVSSMLSALVEAFDPRVQQRTRRRLDDVRDAARELRQTLETVDIRTQQLLALERLNWEQRPRLAAVQSLLREEAIRTHVEAAVERAALVPDPFPHFVVEEWLPGALYDAVLEAIPPAVFFADKPRHRQQVNVPPPVAPEYSRQVWAFVADSIVARIFAPAVERKLADVLDRYVADFCPRAGSDWRQHTMHVSDGRLMLRRPGYLLEPHRDPRWGFVTCLAYLARHGDADVEVYGTQLYRVTNDRTPPDGSVFYVPKEDCELVRTVPFRANQVLVFVNSHGAHGASIPADAKPADLERYLYQFRMGPDPQGVRWLLERMPDSERKGWAGPKTERAGY